MTRLRPARFNPNPSLRRRDTRDQWTRESWYQYSWSCPFCGRKSYKWWDARWLARKAWEVHIEALCNPVPHA